MNPDQQASDDHSVAPGTASEPVSDPSVWRQWAVSSLGLAIVVLGLSIGSRGIADPAFVTGVAVVFAITTGIVHVGFTQSARAVGREPITVATWVTLLRAGPLVVLGGYLFARPAQATVWAPALLYGGAICLDAIDGALARKRDGVTELGRRLDVEVDALGILLGSTVAVVSGATPLAFLLVGLARYGFVGGVTYRRLRGYPIRDLPPSRWRRLLAAAAMIVVWGALAPIPGPAVSRGLTIALIGPFLCHFLYDWLAVSGRLG